MPVLCSCSRPVADGATLCSTCTAELDRLLGDVTALVEELGVTRSRQSRTGDQRIGGGHSTDRPLPWDERASSATEGLRRALADIVRVVRRHHEVPAPGRGLHAVSVWLLGWVTWLRQQPEAGDALATLAEAVRHARKVIDRPPARQYLGPCAEPVDGWTDATGTVRTDCPAELWATTTAATVVCSGCGAEHDVELRREWLLVAAEQQLETATVISQALSRLGQDVTASQIRGWAFRGRLLAHSADLDGRPLYRVGDVIDLVAEVARKANQQRSA